MKKILLCALLITMMCSFFAGCNDAVSDGTTDTLLTTTQTAPETTSASETTASETTTTAPAETTTSKEVPPASEGLVLNVVRNRPFTDNATSRFSEFSNFIEDNQVQFESILVDDIPVLIGRHNTEELKPVFLFVQGGQGCKEQYLEPIFMRVIKDYDGIFVSFDAAAYGESTRGEMTDAETICSAIEDIDKILTYLSTVPDADMGHIFIEGNSMGGAITLAYLAKGSYTPIMATTTVPCADFSLYAKYRDSAPVYNYHGNTPRTGAELSEDQINALLEEYNPIRYADRMTKTFVLSSTGLLDAPFNVESCQALEAKVKELGLTNFDFRYYEIGHDTPLEFRRDLKLSYISEYVSTDPIQNTFPKVTVNETVYAE